MKNVNQINLFFAYAKEDQNLRDRLEKHLAALKRNNHINVWYDGKISPGQEWRNEIELALQKADIILLLISAHFIASDYCYESSIKQAIHRHQTNQSVVIPIVLSPCDWKETPFGTLQALPKDGIPVLDQSWFTEDEALRNIALGIKGIAQSMIQKRTEKVKSYFEEITIIQESINDLNQEQEYLISKNEQLKNEITQLQSENEYLKLTTALKEKEALIETLNQKITALEHQLKTSEINQDHLADPKIQKAIIINDGSAFDTIDNMTNFKWKDKEVMRLAGKKEWKKYGFTPKNGMEGEIVDQFPHYFLDTIVYVLKVDDKFFVPVEAKGIKIISSLTNFVKNE